MTQWNKILGVLAELDFSDFTRIDLPGQTPEEPRGDSCVLLSPHWLTNSGINKGINKIINKNSLDHWHIFSSTYNEDDLTFHMAGDSLCGQCQPTTRLLGGNEDVPASLYYEDARVFFAVLQNNGASICGQCLGALYVNNQDNSDLKMNTLKLLMKRLKLSK